MTDSGLSKGHSEASVHLLPLFLGWYFVGHPLRVLRTFRAYVGAVQESLSILFLLRTLFAPWKSIADAYPKNFFNFSALFETFVFNVVTRSIGAVVRLVTIAAGIVILLAVVCGFLLYLLAWFLFPLALIAGYGTLFVLLLFP